MTTNPTDLEIQEALLKSLRQRQETSVLELEEATSRSLGVGRNRVLRNLAKLREREEVVLEDPSPPANLFRYLATARSAWFWGLVASTVIVGLFVLSPSSLLPLLYLRYATGGTLVLFLPGYGLVETLYPRQADMERLQRVLLSVGLSLALLPFVGLLLDYSPWRITLASTYGALGLLSIFLAVLAALRKVGS